MDNIKHIKTKYSKNDTLMTLLSSVIVFVMPIFVFSFCYLTQNDACAYDVKNINVLEQDLKVVSIQSSSTMRLSLIEYK